MIKKEIYIIIILTILCLLLAGCSGNNKDDEKDLNEKVDSEINYIDSELVNIMSKLNNINYTNYIVETKKVESSADSSGNASSSTQSSSDSSSEEEKSENKNMDNEEEKNNDSQKNKEKINMTEMVAQPSMILDYNNVQWDEILNILETFYTSWNTIILDLYKLNINSSDITDFGKNLDTLLLNVKNKDKILSLESAITLYSYIPKYVDSYKTNITAFKDLATTKLYILNAYVGATKNDWNYSNEQLSLAESSFSNVMKNTEFMKEKEYNINKTYITLKELQNSNQNQDVSLFFFKFKNLIQEIEIL